MEDRNLITRQGFTCEIIPDEDPMNPRTDFDNFGHMACFHRRYNLGDKHSLSVEEALALEKDPAVISLPLWIIDHSGLSISTGNFDDCDPGRWDSGRVGIIYVTMEEITKEYGSCGPQEQKKALLVMESEVEQYDQYLRGDVYGFVIKDPDGETIDSCWGYFGYKYASAAILEEAVAIIDAEVIRRYNSTIELRAALCAAM